MNRFIKTLMLTTAVTGTLALAGCKTGSSGTSTGGAISPATPIATAKVPSNMVKLSSGVPSINAMLPPGGNVAVYDDSTHLVVWQGTVKPGTVITVAPAGVYLDNLKKQSLKNPRAKHTIYFVKPQN